MNLKSLGPMPMFDCYVQHSSQISPGEDSGGWKKKWRQESACRKLESGGASLLIGEKEAPSGCSVFIYILRGCYQLKVLCLTTCLPCSPQEPLVLGNGTACSCGSPQVLHILGAGLASALHMCLISSFSRSVHFTCVTSFNPHHYLSLPLHRRTVYLWSDNLTRRWRLGLETKQSGLGLGPC